eukprot:836522-Pleurochrysis_carterae.AAC.2
MAMGRKGTVVLRRLFLITGRPTELTYTSRPLVVVDSRVPCQHWQYTALRLPVVGSRQERRAAARIEACKLRLGNHSCMLLARR